MTDDQPLERWRPGVHTRMLASALTGTRHLCLFEQFCDPGAGAPTHTHTVEEILTVRAGLAHLTIGAETTTLRPGQSAVIAPGLPHAFRNPGPTPLHIQAVLAAPSFEAAFESRTETTRRWHLPDLPLPEAPRQ